MGKETQSSGATDIGQKRDAESLRLCVRRFMSKHNLLNTRELYLVALSGGADSVALLLLLVEMGCQVHAAHCNFHLRGAESDRDERFCADLCQRLGIELHRAHFDTLAYAESHHVSIEMAARELRYRWFGQLSSDIGAAGVCVAHHRDDSVETVLLNMVRGTGLRGLTGIQPVSYASRGRLRVVRPLLCASRVEIEAYLSDKGQGYVTDSTNLEADVQRNRIRLQVLPLLRKLNPAVDDHISQMAENLLEAQKTLDAVSEVYLNSKELNLCELDKFGSREYFVFEWAKNYGFNGSQIAQILKAKTGRVFSSPTGYDLLADRGRLIVEPALKPLRSVRVPEEGVYVLDDDRRFSVRRKSRCVSKSPTTATLDARRVVFPLTVRRVGEGDWMIPFGMRGRKLLSDLMTDRKMTVFEKRRQLVVEDARGVVLWLVGVRTDARAAVTDSTAEVLELCLE